MFFVIFQEDGFKLFEGRYKYINDIYYLLNIFSDMKADTLVSGKNQG